jgi:N-acetylglucosaminyldiphosphoundecaprenol N-acetyl-beta-D-mannosaminyltransferase
MNKINLLDIHFDNISIKDAVDLIFTATQSKTQKLISFINAHCLNIATQDEEYRHILQKNNHIFPDGSGVNLACKMIGHEVLENVNGTDMLPLICQRATVEKKSIFLLGAEEKVALEMKIKLQSQFPNLKISGEHHGFFDFEQESDGIIKTINDSQTDILLIGFGTPIQEKWMAKNAAKINSKVLIGVGGLFDFYSGRKPRAPLFLRKHGLEWCYRFYLEPQRLFKRYIIGNPLFIWRVLKWKYLSRK